MILFGVTLGWPSAFCSQPEPTPDPESPRDTTPEPSPPPPAPEDPNAAQFQRLCYRCRQREWGWECHSLLAALCLAHCTNDAARGLVLQHHFVRHRFTQSRKTALSLYGPEVFSLVVSWDINESVKTLAKSFLLSVLLELSEGFRRTITELLFQRLSDASGEASNWWTCKMLGELASEDEELKSKLFECVFNASEDICLNALDSCM